jgi:hypothetical protein
MTSEFFLEKFSLNGFPKNINPLNALIVASAVSSSYMTTKA